MLQAPHNIIIHVKCFDYPIAMYFTVQMFKLTALDFVLECMNASTSVNLKHLQSVIDPKKAPNKALDKNSAIAFTSF